MVIEKYRVTLEHFYEFTEPNKPATKSDIDSPIIGECCGDPSFVPDNIVLNDMLGRLMESILVRVREEVKL